MVEAPLVVPDLEFGKKVLRVLDAAKFPVTVVMWMKDKDDVWKLVLASPLYDELGPHKAYTLLREALSTDGPTVLFDLPLELFGHQDPLIKELRKTYRKDPSAAGMRPSHRLIGDVYVADSYVYRIK